MEWSSRRSCRLNIQTLYFVTTCGLSLVTSVYYGVLLTHGMAPGDRLSSLWFGVFGLLMAVWAGLDARSRGARNGFDFEFYVFMFWSAALPYYLTKTRGLRGLMLGLGLCLVGFGPMLVWVGIYVISRGAAI
jgi:hypothetical protein